MTGATLEELRDLSRRSRRAQRWGALAILATLLLVPLGSLLESTLGAGWTQYATVLAGGLLFLVYAYYAGEERGAFRKVFRRIKDERRVRTLVPEGPEKEPAAVELTVRRE